MSASGQRRRRCLVKIHYPDFAAAERACLAMLAKEGSVLYAYRCPFCARGYAIGHPPLGLRVYWPPADRTRMTPRALRVRAR